MPQPPQHSITKLKLIVHKLKYPTMKYVNKTKSIVWRVSNCLSGSNLNMYSCVFENTKTILNHDYCFYDHSKIYIITTIVCLTSNKNIYRSLVHIVPNIMRGGGTQFV
jgi:hypothetical protein